MSVLDNIDTIALLMFENRSFDHLLGHLSLEDPTSQVDGLRNIATDPIYANLHQNRVYRPFPIHDADITHDPPHGRDFVALQLAAKGDKFRMSGFARAYIEHTLHAVPQPAALGYFDSQSAWMSSFLAKNFCVCDRWFAPVPADTQPNRSMAFTGQTLVDDTKPRAIPNRDHVLSWLHGRQLRWRVYYDGPSYFLLFAGLDAFVLGPNFRSIDHLQEDMRTEPLDKTPQVMIIEPRYFDYPWSKLPANDNHPLGHISDGERHLHRVYSALTINPEKWARTLFIVYYDEHGGFFDHVPPLPIVSPKPPGAEKKSKPFQSTGPRVPAIIASPWVRQGSVFHGPLDHTSVLQLLSEKFTGDPTHYSHSVNARRAQGIGSVSGVIDPGLTRGRPVVPAPVVPGSVPTPSPKRPPQTPQEYAFDRAARRLLARWGPAAKAKIPDLDEVPPTPEG
jgi:phospholipase C